MTEDIVRVRGFYFLGEDLPIEALDEYMTPEEKIFGVLAKYEQDREFFQEKLLYELDNIESML